MQRRVLHDGPAEAAGLNPDALRAAARLVDDACRTGLCGAVSLVVARRGVVALRALSGQVAPGGRRLKADDLFLIASPTKPLVCLMLLKLVETGGLRLRDTVRDYLPELADPGFATLRLEHLLTHTSGLPDQLPDNLALRARHAPLSDFLAGALAQPAAFRPGTDCAYQSMGILLLSAIAERLTGQSMRQLLEDRLFVPLRCRLAVLGTREGYQARLVQVRLPAAQQGGEGHWNTAYWRALGCPWGGLHATADELAAVLQMMLNGGSYGDVELLAPATVAAATAHQTARLSDLPDEVARRHRWGYGWRLGGGDLPAAWPELASPRSFGHTGATGTIVFADPESEVLAVLLTDTPGPAADRLRARLTNLVAAAWR